MDITTLLSELVVISESLEKRGLNDVSAGLDAALFLMTQETALPKNKSLASVVRENKVTLEGKTGEELEDIAVGSATEIRELTEAVLGLDMVTIAAVLKSVAQSMRSVLDSAGALSPEVAKASAELLVEAEKKLALDDSLNGVGYQIAVIRGKIENG